MHVLKFQISSLHSASLDISKLPIYCQSLSQISFLSHSHLNRHKYLDLLLWTDYSSFIYKLKHVSIGNEGYIQMRGVSVGNEDVVRWVDCEASCFRLIGEKIGAGNILICFLNSLMKQMSSLFSILSFVVLIPC